MTQRTPVLDVIHDDDSFGIKSLLNLGKAGHFRDVSLYPFSLGCPVSSKKFLI